MVITRMNPDNALGLLDKLIGLNKEIAGHVLGRDNLIEAGEAQQDKGTEKLKALREQGKADAHLTKARAHESREKAAQRS
jgi:uncharacterized protein YjbJ (UPF0337 family)